MKQRYKETMNSIFILLIETKIKLSRCKDTKKGANCLRRQFSHNTGITYLVSKHGTFERCLLFMLDTPELRHLVSQHAT